MKFLVEMLAGFIAMIAAAMLSQFGVELHSSKSMDREIERVHICAPDQAANVTAKAPPHC